jgi:hypothetical protein
LVWLLLTEPTYNRTRRAALAWRARILSQKALRSESFAGSIPAASIIDRSPLRLAPQHDDFGRFFFHRPDALIVKTLKMSAGDTIQLT